MGNIATSLLKICNPDPEKAGKTLLVLNAVGLVFAAICNVTAMAVDKSTPQEDKKFLVPAGVVTGVTKIALYYTLTDKIIKNFKKATTKLTNNMSDETLTKNATSLAKSNIKRAEEGTIFGLGKKSTEYISAMKNSLFKNGDIEQGITKKAKEMYKDNTKAAAGVSGAFLGAVIGCSIVTPIVRDISGYFVQKRMEKLNPDLKNKPYYPYFKPASFNITRYGKVQKKINKQPLSMKSYMTFSNRNNLSV